MNWTKLIYVVIIILLYIPMAFLGINVFFPEYSGNDRYYAPYDDCYKPVRIPTEEMTDEDIEAQAEQQRECREKSKEEQDKWEEDRNAYEGRKYVTISIFNLIILLIALLIVMKDSIVMGLFLGSIITTFSATIRYFDSRSKIGFLVLVVTFFTMLYFINKKKDKVIDWKTDEKSAVKKKRKRR